VLEAGAVCPRLYNRRSVRRVVLALAALLIVAGGAVGAWYYHDQTRTREKRGSSTVEFAPAKPAVQKRPVKSIAVVPWPMYGYDPARTHDAIQFHVRPPFKKIWTYRLGNIVEFPPVVGYGVLFVNQYRGRFFAIDAATGKRRWRKHFKNCGAASAAIGRDIVYQAYMQPYPCDRYPRSQRGFIVAILIRDKHGHSIRGRILWRYHTGAIESSPLLVNQRLYFGSWDHHVYALDVRGRKRRPRLMWKFHADDEVNSSPAYGSGVVYFGSNSGSLYAVDARTGRLRWRATSYARFGRREQFYATPAVAYGRVYAGNTDGTVYAFGAGTGHLLWARHVGTYVYTAPAVWNRKIYVGTYDGKLLALNAATGDTVWSHDAPAAIHGAPTVLAGVVYFSTCPFCGSHGSRYARSGPRGTFGLDARNGRILWRFTDGQYSPVIADSERIYVAGRTHVYGFEPLRKQHAKKHESRKRREQP
jgi:outer membrane protein assembly factor BamB